MEVFKIDNMQGGWYAGNFSPVAFSTSDFEVCYKKHIQGEDWPKHYHKEADEINFLRSGKMIIQGTELVAATYSYLGKVKLQTQFFLKIARSL